MNSFLLRARRNINTQMIRWSILRNGFWFIDIPRTSSSSIRSELGKRCGRAYGKKSILEQEHATRQFFADHIPARKMRDFLGNSIWERIFTFTIVRNPWDRTYSMYNYRMKKGSIPSDWRFRDYVLALGEASSDTQYFKFHGFRYGASDYILGENGETMVDFIGKYENRSHDLNLIASRIHIDQLGELCLQRATPKNRHYANFYDEETREIIRRLYAKDIELFDYEFDDQP